MEKVLPVLISLSVKYAFADPTVEEDTNVTVRKLKSIFLIVITSL